MKQFERDELTDLELKGLLSAWTVPDPPDNLRTRIFSGKENVAMSAGIFTLEMLSTVEQPWYGSLFCGLKDLIYPRKLSPLDITSKPVEVGSIWESYRARQSRTLGVAVLLQSAAVALLLLQSPVARQTISKSSEAIYLTSYRPKLPASSHPAGGGGGGGQQASKPVAKGAAPEYAARQFIPPAIAVSKPLLPVVPTISAPAPQIEAQNYGDPLSRLNDESGGQGKNGFGNGAGGGVGGGDGDGYESGYGGGQGGGAYRIGGDVSSPVLLSKVEPEYSEEARKAKYSGTVMLSVVVDEHGIPIDIHVVRPLGLGLDEKAIEAVQHWRFRPGYRIGKPVRVIAMIEVNFRLL